MNRFVRTSKYRHVFGTQSKVEECYTETKMTRSAWDSNMISCGTKNFSMIWDVAGGGAFATIPYDRFGKQTDVCLFTGHKATVLDLDYNPFNDDLIASSSEDCLVRIWGIPEGCPGSTNNTPLQTLTGHRRKVGTVNFHPCASNVLATTSADSTLKLWDVEQGEEMFSCEGFTDIVNSCCWNKDGSEIVTSCKDKKMRIFDPRTNTITAEVMAHVGTKGVRCLWMTDKNYLFTTGFTRNAEREMAFWDPRNIEKPLTRHTIDNQSGVLMPFYDPDTSILYLGGKGDSSISYYEIVDDKPYYHALSNFMGKNPQSGLGCIPKRICNTSSCEVARFLKVTKVGVLPVSFCVPRKSELFQEDLYPNTYAGVPTLTAAEWKDGQNKEPDCSFNFEPGFVAPEKPATTFNPVVKEAEPEKSEKEIKEEWEQLKKRVAFLESEVTKKDNIIADLNAKIESAGAPKEEAPQEEAPQEEVPEEQEAPQEEEVEPEQEAPQEEEVEPEQE